MLSALAMLPGSAEAAAVRTTHAEAELVTDVSSIAPGDSFWAALRLKPDTGWYVYWSNPGDAGLPPSVEWGTPPGWKTGPLQFPYPALIESPPFASYGYKGEVWYPVRVTAVEGFSADEPVVLRAAAEWLICREACVPESANLERTLRTGETKIDDDRAPMWAATLEALPMPVPEWEWRAVYDDTTLQISWNTPAGWDPTGTLLFFPLDQGVLEHVAPQRVHGDRGRVVLTLKRDPVIEAKPRVVRGVLVSQTIWPIEQTDTTLRRAAVLVEIDTEARRTGGGPGWINMLILGILVLAAFGLLAVMKRPHINRRNG